MFAILTVTGGEALRHKNIHSFLSEHIALIKIYRLDKKKR